MKSYLQLPALILAVFLACSVQAHAQGEQATEQNLSQYQGQLVLLDFWASWCGPCRRSFPWMNAMQAEYGERGLTVIAVNLDQEAADAAAFLERYPAHFTIWYDPDGELAKTYKVEAMPTSLLLDRQGKVISVHRGFKTKQIAAYEQAIKQAL